MLNKKAIIRIVETCRQEHRKVLTPYESMQILSSSGIPVARGDLATSQQEAITMANRVGFPVAMKIVSPQIIHKTDAGCVRLNVAEKDLPKHYDGILANAKAYDSEARLEGVLIQEMSDQGVEVIIGTFVDPTFGQTIMFGLGGVFVEILKDVAFRLIPVDELDVHEMVEEIRGYPVLLGARGSPPADLPALETMLLEVSRLLEEIPEFREMDLNPVIVSETGARVVDARILLT